MSTMTNSAPTKRGTSKGVGAVILVLAALTALAPLANGMYIPGLPEVARSFAATDSSVQLSITAFLIGLAAGQILLGPISDALGRRLVLLTGTSLFAVFSLICAVAPSIEIFNVARLIEGFSAAAGIAVARAFLTDWFYGTREAARHFPTLSAIVVVAPVAAPILGGMVLGFALWRTIFVVLAVFGFLLAVIVAAWLPNPFLVIADAAADWPEHSRPCRASSAGTRSWGTFSPPHSPALPSSCTSPARPSSSGTPMASLPPGSP